MKQILKTKGYGSEETDDVNDAETPLQRKIFSKNRRKNFLDLLALLTVIVALLFGGFFSYSVIHKPTSEEMIMNLSGVYGDITVMKVVGDSMEPTFSDGQLVFVSNAYYKNNTPEKGDIGVAYFKLSDAFIVKRVAATSLDKIDEKEYDLRGTLLLKQLRYYNYTVPIGTVILLGDNPEKSVDSRQYGIIPVQLIEGKVVK